MSKSLKSLIKNIENHLKRLAWTQKKLAEVANISPPRLSQYLQENHTPSLEVVERIAAALNIQSWELMKPLEAIETQIPPSPTIESLTGIISAQEKQIEDLLKNQAFEVARERQPQLKFFIDFINTADEVELNETIKRIESVRKITREKNLKRGEKSKGRSGSTF